MNAPIPWLQLQEDISNPDVDTKMKDARNLVGESKSLTLDELNDLKQKASEHDDIEYFGISRFVDGEIVVTHIIDNGPKTDSAGFTEEDR